MKRSTRFVFVLLLCANCAPIGASDREQYIKSYETFGANAPPIYDPTITDLTKLLKGKTMEFHYGQPLDWFFRQWGFEPGYPVYDATWSWDETAKELKLRVAQKQSPTVFRIQA